MKKFLFLCLFLTVGVVSCSSCAKQPQVEPSPAPTAPVPTVTTPPPPPPPPPPTTVTVSGKGWELTFPDNGWKALEPPEGGLSVPFLNPSRDNLVIVSTEEFTGNYQQYVLLGIQGVRSAGGVVDSTKQVTSNGTNFTLVDSHKNQVRVFMWIGVKNGSGYVLTCGGPDDGKQFDTCSTIFDTLKIK